MKTIQNIHKAFRYELLAFLSGMMLLSACSKYNGEMEYHAINEVSLSKEDAVGSIPKKIGDSLKLTPKIVQKDATDEKNLSYLWTSYEIQTNNKPDTLSTDRNLKMEVKFPFVLGKSYMITFRAKEGNTGVSTYLQYIVNVVNDLREGWMVMEDRPEGADFSMVLPDHRIFRNLYSTLNGAPVKERPVKLDLSFEVVTDGISPASRKIYMLTEKKGTELDYLTLTNKYPFESLLFRSPDVVKPTYMNWSAISVGNQIGTIVNDGKLHIAIVGGFPGGKKWGEQLLVTEGTGLNYNLFPFVAVGGATAGANINYQIMVYDNLNKRFYGGKTPITSLTPFSTAASSVFDLNNVGMEMLYMGASPVANQYNAIMKDASGDSYFLQFKTNYTAAAPVLTTAKIKMNAPEIGNFAGAGASYITPHIFYGAGNKIYRYEPGSNSTLLQYAFAANEQITAVYCPIPLIAPTVAVATWNGTESKLYTFEISFVGPSVGQIQNYSKVYGGFAKIVDVKYKFI